MRRVGATLRAAAVGRRAGPHADEA